MSSMPPGWPQRVPPPGAPGWEPSAVEWLLDHCPADYRGYAAWRRHPVALAWLTVRHLRAQLAAMRESWRDIRPELGEQLPTEALDDVLEHLAEEGLRLRAALRSAERIHEALQGKAYVPRL